MWWHFCSHDPQSICISRRWLLVCFFTFWQSRTFSRQTCLLSCCIPVLLLPHMLCLSYESRDVNQTLILKISNLQYCFTFTEQVYIPNTDTSIFVKHNTKTLNLEYWIILTWFFAYWKITWEFKIISEHDFQEMCGVKWGTSEILLL